MLDKLGKVGRAGCHLDTQALSEFDILVELGRDVGRGVLGSSGAGKGNLHGVEVPNAPQNGQVHRLDLRRSSFLTYMRRWVVSIPRRERGSSRCLEDIMRVTSEF